MLLSVGYLLEMEAMMIRAKAARKLVRNHTITGEEALAMVVLPSKKLEAETLAIATEKGVHPDTVTLFGRRARTNRGRVGCELKPREKTAPPPEKKIVTLDELAALY